MIRPLLQTAFIAVIPPVAIKIGTGIYSYWIRPKHCGIKNERSIENLFRLAVASLDELPTLVPTEGAYKATPLVHHGRWHYKNSKEYLNDVSSIANIAKLGILFGTAASISAYMLGSCTLRSGQVEACFNEFEFFLSEGSLGIFLLASGIVVATLWNLVGSSIEVYFKEDYFKYIFNPFREKRIKEVVQEYTRICSVLKQLHEKGQGNPEICAATKVLVQKLLRNLPMIEKALIHSIGLEEAQAQAIVLPLTNLCQDILA